MLQYAKYPEHSIGSHHKLEAVLYILYMSKKQSKNLLDRINKAPFNSMFENSNIWILMCLYRQDSWLYSALFWCNADNENPDKNIEK